LLLYGRQSNLYVIDVDGTNLTPLTHNTKCFGKGFGIQEHLDEDAGILFPPNSKKIAFVLPVRYDMYVVNVDGTGLTRLTHTKAQEEKIVTWAGG
jgi:Tol biopolymer transport system component